MKLLTTIIALFVAATFSALAADAAPRKGKLYHVVAFKFKDTASKADIQKVEEAFRALPKKIKEIKSLEWGTNVSPEKLNKGFTHGFVLTFATEKDRNAYIVHPDHKAFGSIVGPVLADVFVIDFWAEK
jgi:hypothetical protein